MKITYFLFISILLISCSRKTTKELSNKMIELKSENGIPNDFSKLDKYIENKEIILLGEAAHGDGKTFEVKTQIVKYLIEEKGFNTVAFEGLDFLQMEYINGRSILKNNLVDNFESEWYDNWNPWNRAKQLIPFENFIKNKNISFVGIEPYENLTALINIDFIKIELEKSDWVLINKNEQIKLSTLFDKLIKEEKLFSQDEFDYFTLQLEKIIKDNETIYFNDNFFKQMLENLITHMKLEFNPKTFSNEDEETAYSIFQRVVAHTFLWIRRKGSESPSNATDFQAKRYS